MLNLTSARRRVETPQLGDVLKRHAQPQGTFKVAFDRVFKNVNSAGRLQRVRVTPDRRVLGNYDISIGPVTVSRQQ